MTSKTHQGGQLEITNFFQIISQRKWFIFCCIVLAIAVATVINYLYRPIYKTRTVIIFEEVQTSASIINPFRLGFDKSFITNQLEEIKSRSLAEEVLQSLPPGIINTFVLPVPISMK